MSLFIPTVWLRRRREGPREADDLVREDRPAVEEQPVVHDPSDHRRVAPPEARVEAPRVRRAVADRAGGRRQLHPPPRAPPALGPVVPPPRGRAPPPCPREAPGAPP